MGRFIERDYAEMPTPWDLRQLLRLGSFCGRMVDGYPAGHGIFTYKSGTVVKGGFYEGRPNGWVDVGYDCACKFEGTVGPSNETGDWGGFGELRLICEQHRKGIFFARQPVKSEQIIFPLGHVLRGLFHFVIAEDFWPIPIDITEGMNLGRWA